MRPHALGHTSPGSYLPAGEVKTDNSNYIPTVGFTSRHLMVAPTGNFVLEELADRMRTDPLPGWLMEQEQGRECRASRVTSCVMGANGAFKGGLALSWSERRRAAEGRSRRQRDRTTGVGVRNMVVSIDRSRAGRTLTLHRAMKSRPSPKNLCDGSVKGLPGLARQPAGASKLVMGAARDRSDATYKTGAARAILDREMFDKHNRGWVIRHPVTPGRLRR